MIVLIFATLLVICWMLWNDKDVEPVINVEVNIDNILAEDTEEPTAKDIDAEVFDDVFLKGLNLKMEDDNEQRN